MNEEQIKAYIDQKLDERAQRSAETIAGKPQGPAIAGVLSDGGRSIRDFAEPEHDGPERFIAPSRPSPSDIPILEAWLDEKRRRRADEGNEETTDG